MYNDKILFSVVTNLMKKSLIFVVLMLGHFSINAEDISLQCSPKQPICENCPDYATLFPVEKLSENTESLEIEADKSEILEEKYHLSGNVEVNTEKLFLSADDVEVYSADNSILATGNVKFQDEAFLITSDSLSASRENDNLIAVAENANYQDYSVGLGGANGYTDRIEKTPSTVLLTNSTYSLCPVTKNDWLIKADQIELNLDKNRGVADNAIIKFYGVPIFYTPKHSWVLSGRGSGFLSPDYSKYKEPGEDDNSTKLRVPFYVNLAPDRDLLLALTFMSSRGLNFEGKYRQLIKPLSETDFQNSKFELEAKYLNEDRVNHLQRWLLKFNEEFDINNKTHLSAQYYRVSDSKYFEEIARTNTNVDTVNSYLKLNYDDSDNNLSGYVYTEEVQVVNDGNPGYFRALEGSVEKNLTFGQNKIDGYDKSTEEFTPLETMNSETGALGNKIEKTQNTIEDSMQITTNLNLGLVSTKFVHDVGSKENGVRTHANAGVSRPINVKYPKITPSASIAFTNYSLKNTPDINRTIFGSGLDIDFTFNTKSNLFGFDVNNRISPKITYNYRGKVVQGNIPIFDTTDKYDDILSFASLTSGERYTGLDRITNANDITISLASVYSLFTKPKTDEESKLTDILSLQIAQSFYTDDEVVSDIANTNYESRRSYSDIAASMNLTVNKFNFSSAAQFNPDTSKIERKENTISYSPSSRQFLSMSFIDDGAHETEKFYGAYRLNDAIHIFGGLDKNTSTGITNLETSGIAYESCCWAFRVAHFKEKVSAGYSYSTGMELVLTGLGSTSTPLKGQIETNIPGYAAKLR
jgi:LPS-assembly protein